MAKNKNDFKVPNTFYLLDLHPSRSKLILKLIIICKPTALYCWGGGVYLNNLEVILDCILHKKARVSAKNPLKLNILLTFVESLLFLLAVPPLLPPVINSMLFWLAELLDPPAKAGILSSLVMLSSIVSSRLLCLK